MTSDDRKQSIQLDEILSNYEIASFDSGWQPGEEMFICPNMRAAAIHLRNESGSDALDRRKEITRVLLRDERIDQVIYPCSPTSETRASLPLSHRWFQVVTHDRGRLVFSHVDSADDLSERLPGSIQTASDNFGNTWKISGDARALDLRMEGGRIVEGKYPNALERIAGAYEQGRSPLYVTAKEGCEFCVAETNIHPGGSHGSLCADDAEAALITFGTQDVPDVVRSIDVLDLCVREFASNARKSVSRDDDGMATAVKPRALTDVR